MALAPPYDVFSLTQAWRRQVEDWSVGHNCVTVISLAWPAGRRYVSLKSFDAPGESGDLGVRFIMMDGEKSVACFVSREALEDVEGGKAESAETRLERFLRHRSTFEMIARDLYETGISGPIIESAHLTRRRM
jgi:hypothetical protein